MCPHRKLNPVLLCLLIPQPAVNAVHNYDSGGGGGGGGGGDLLQMTFVHKRQGQTYCYLQPLLKVAGAL